MDFYSRGLGAIKEYTLSDALSSIRGTPIITQSVGNKRCGNCKFFLPAGSGGIGSCKLHTRKERRPVKTYQNWHCRAFKPAKSVANLGTATFTKAFLADGRDVTPGDAPWSKRGEYGHNVKLIQNGSVFAILNFGNNVRTTLKEGKHLPLGDIFRIKSLGEKNGVWTIEATTDVQPGYFDQLLRQTNYRFTFTITPQFYSARPLLITWTALDEALYDSASSGTKRTHRDVIRRGHDTVPAGQVTDLTGQLVADVERPHFAEPGTENHRITRRITFKVRCRHA